MKTLLLMIFIISIMHCHANKTTSSNESCESTSRLFESSLDKSNSSLTSYLEVLNNSNCSKTLKNECKKRRFQLNKFTELVYDRHCEKNELIHKCSEEIGAKQNWTTAVLALSKLSKEELQKPCYQAALYDKVLMNNNGSSAGKFAEVKELYFPFCEYIWCGADLNNMDQLSVSMCASSLCTGNTYFLHIFHIVSALAIIAVNSISLYIFGKNPKMKTPQHLYRFNLAVADLMVGFFAFFPSVYFANRKFNNEAITNKEFFYFSNKSDVLQTEPNTLERFVGFLSWLSLFVSGFTLISASFDRVFATIFPTRYIKRNNCYVTIVVCVVGWIASVCNFTMYFDSTSSIVTTPYFVVEAFDRTLLLRTLVLNLFLLVSMIASCSIVMLVLYSRNRRMKENNIRRSAQTEVRIAKTLFIMVIVFLLSELPSTAMLIWGYLDPSTLGTDNWEKHKLYMQFFHISIVLVYYNSFWNFFIYQTRDKEFKKSLRKLKSRVLSKFRKIGKSRNVKRNKNVKPNETPGRKTVVTEV